MNSIYFFLSRRPSKLEQCPDTVEVCLNETWVCLGSFHFQLSFTALWNVIASWEETRGAVGKRERQMDLFSELGVVNFGGFEFRVDDVVTDACTSGFTFAMVA